MHLRLLALALSCMAHTAGAQEPSAPAAPACLEPAAQYHSVNPWVLRAIIWHESRNNPALVLRNRNGSLDLGAAGINTAHLAELKRYGIEGPHLLDACVNTYVAAWHLAKQQKTYGNTWTAVGAYHSKNPANGDPYIGHIKRVLVSWGVLVAR